MASQEKLLPVIDRVKAGAHISDLATYQKVPALAAAKCVIYNLNAFRCMRRASETLINSGDV